MWNHVEPHQIEVTSGTDNKWRWAIWYGPGNNAPDVRDSNGTEETLGLALSAVQSRLYNAITRALAYD